MLSIVATGVLAHLICPARIAAMEPHASYNPVQDCPPSLKMHVWLDCTTLLLRHVSHLHGRTGLVYTLANVECQQCMLKHGASHSSLPTSSLPSAS